MASASSEFLIPEAMRALTSGALMFDSCSFVSAFGLAWNADTKQLLLSTLKNDRLEKPNASTDMEQRKTNKIPDTERRGELQEVSCTSQHISSTE